MDIQLASSAVILVVAQLIWEHNYFLFARRPCPIGETQHHHRQILLTTNPVFVLMFNRILQSSRRLVAGQGVGAEIHTGQLSPEICRGPRYGRQLVVLPQLVALVVIVLVTLLFLMQDFSPPGVKWAVRVYSVFVNRFKLDKFAASSCLGPRGKAEKKAEARVSSRRKVSHSWGPKVEHFIATYA